MTTPVVLELPFDVDAPALARRFLREHASALPPDLCDDAVVIVSELVTNAIRYGRPTITLNVGFEPPGISVGVTDAGGDLPIVGDADPAGTAASGRGLLIVEALANRWGVRRNVGDGGKTVWFELHWPRSGGAPATDPANHA